MTSMNNGNLPENITTIVSKVRKDCIDIMTACGYEVCHSYDAPPKVLMKSVDDFEGECSAYHDNETNTIVFKEGTFSLDLLAHELTHSLQPEKLFLDDEYLDYHERRSEIQAYVVASLVDVKYRTGCSNLVYRSLITNMTKKIVRNMERNCKELTFRMYRN